MTETPAPDLRALRELAEAATPGPWQTGLGCVVWGADKVGDLGHELIAEGCAAENGRFIAVANPRAVLALLDELEALREENDALGAGCCSTPCDDDCEVACHEGHVSRLARDHDPETCPATLRRERDEMRAKVERAEALADKWTSFIGQVYADDLRDALGDY